MGILLNQFLDKIYLEMIIILTFLQEVLNVLHWEIA